MAWRWLSGVSGNSRASLLLVGCASMAAARFGQWLRHAQCRSPLTRYRAASCNARRQGYCQRATVCSNGSGGRVTVLANFPRPPTATAPKSRLQRRQSGRALARPQLPLRQGAISTFQLRVGGGSRVTRNAAVTFRRRRERPTSARQLCGTGTGPQQQGSSWTCGVGALAFRPCPVPGGGRSLPSTQTTEPSYCNVDANQRRESPSPRVT